MSGLIALDWGTSSLRAFRFDGAGRLAETRTRPWGIRHLPEGGCDAALAGITAGWPALPRLACGMVGSRNGWHEMPYLDTPANAMQLGGALGSVRAADGMDVHLVPGLRDPLGPDVMRGEETQLVGALALRPALAGAATFILPGTHSKWAVVRDGAVTGFRTVMTGELFAVLLRHSILGATGAEAADDAEAFARGVADARGSGAAGALGRLFSARALMLDGALAPASVPDYLSGLLIGEEFRAALASGLARRDTPLQLIGEAALCGRYRRAAALFDIDLPPPIADAAAHGLRQLATLAGLVHPAPEESRAC
ncbi:2-dehydro-3-deoxygalactonokinase [Rhodanobacter sp. DHB23]|uniref:2-dehydro-3-deoxygalactonokinase n=1 Tax=Rhodanobacter sp. DHB23 TaxID=2775923 RepID=UPI00177E016D|nr:2-dehydro-3-deoxygalactonokinase [Rhodanobacter sp. DHB23]MBD8872761.1 2-dehydro-3-deoxygalactonokinase [Rhodanobacter sp. DHB23]